MVGSSATPVIVAYVRIVLPLLTCKYAKLPPGYSWRSSLSGVQVTVTVQVPPLAATAALQLLAVIQ